jgi:hypothetical protein
VTSSPQRRGRVAGNESWYKTASGTRKSWRGKKRTLDLGERPGRNRGGDSREFTSGNTTTIYDAGGRNVGRYTTSR